eukprot:CAMPEP_0201948696 /NCGR_PEP_ID=MMETSP0903-20130614/55593_1 /ASSEMBLY_ACC=CAM_ASM_000552 /TAXON_ID=420261 /ORGANISM="Thalassiosira antarctica, Strain CCMP982" /LENGTH=448 /DNA_ID=CAMNT_0048491885 /DNA_START=73 /DNA_END=1419 /DNA_ORIENTATION=+
MEQQSQQQTPADTTSPPFPRTFYRRQLPSTSISFSSPEGRGVFASAMASGGTHSFFPLIEQLQTQPEPAFCGLTTLVIVLNALAVDPRRSWKGPWRWYEESMLNCCVDLEKVKKTGITFSTFACLAKCQGININAVHGSNSTVDEFRRVVKETCTASSPIQTTRATSFLIVSYTRKVIGQTGTGHFSPIGAYDEASDHVLVLDTARFKYGPHWVPLDLMFEALLPLDPDTGKSRGYMVLSYDGLDGTGLTNGEEDLSHLPLSVLFGSKKSKDFMRREYKQYLQELEKEGDCSITLTSVVSFWTKNYTDNNHMREIVEPQIQPVDLADIQMVESIRRLLKSLVKLDEHSSSIPESMFSTSIRASSDCRPDECCHPSTRNASGRVLEISPAEVLYVIYLASLPKDVRRDIVYTKDVDESNVLNVDDITRDQLLAEAALISYAMETCDVVI